MQAEDGTQALEICLEQTPDIAVVDINIPGITGLELIRILSSFEETADLCEVYELFAGDRPYARFQSWLQDILEGSQSADTQGQDAVTYILSWMEEHYMEDITRQDAANAAGLSETYFSNQFSRNAGTTFVNSLNEIRIRHARERMQAGEKNLKEIAAACGFYNYKYFLDVFRKYAGQSATEYMRKQETEEDQA